MDYISFVLISLPFLSVLFYVVEMIGVDTFIRFFYKTGIPVYSKIFYLNRSITGFSQNNIFYSRHGKFKYNSDRKIYFVAKQSLFSVQTPFTFKGVADISNAEKVIISAKIPLGSTFFLFFVGLCLGTINFHFVHFFLYSSIKEIELTGTIVIVFLCCLFIERKRMDRLVKELNEILSEN